MDFASIGQVNHITQRCNQKLSQIENSDPMIIYVISGEKQIECAGKLVTVKAGQLLAVPANTVMNVTNFFTDQDDYQAICFSWHAELLQQFYLSTLSKIHIKSNALKTISVVSTLPDHFSVRLMQIKTELFSYYQADNQHNNPLNDNLIQHLFSELLIRLATLHIYFTPQHDQTLTQKVRQLISQEPDKKWQSLEIAKQFAMSESTLRRHLASESHNLSQIILDVRLNHGLMLLQTTQKPILQIAQDIGYDSGSRFAMHFKKRFGFPPKMLRV